MAASVEFASLLLLAIMARKFLLSFYWSSQMPLSVGTQLGSLKITERVGVGGMGEVYRARDFEVEA